MLVYCNNRLRLLLKQFIY